MASERPASSKGVAAASPSSARKKKVDPTEQYVADVRVMIKEHQALSSNARVKALLHHILATDKDTRQTINKTPAISIAMGIIDRAYLYILKERDQTIDKLQAEILMMKGGYEQLKQDAETASTSQGAAETELEKANERIQKLEADNRAMLEDLQRAEYAAAAATSECLALQEAAAGIAVADSRRQKLVAMRLAELKEELRRTKYQLRSTRLDGKKAQLGIMKLESAQRTILHEQQVLKESLSTNGVDLELLEAQRNAPRPGRQQNTKYVTDPEARLRAIKQPASYALFDMVPVPKELPKKRKSHRTQFSGLTGVAAAPVAGKENARPATGRHADDDARSVRSAMSTKSLM